MSHLSSNIFANSLEDAYLHQAHLAASAELEKLDRQEQDLRDVSDKLTAPMAIPHYGVVRPPKARARAIRWHDLPSTNRSRELLKLHQLLRDRPTSFHQFVVRATEDGADVNTVSVAEALATTSTATLAKHLRVFAALTSAATADLQTPAGLSDAIRRVASSGRVGTARVAGYTLQFLAKRLGAVALGAAADHAQVRATLTALNASAAASVKRLDKKPLTFSDLEVLEARVLDREELDDNRLFSGSLLVCASLRARYGDASKIYSIRTEGSGRLLRLYATTSSTKTSNVPVTLFGVAAALVDSSCHWFVEWSSLRKELGFDLSTSQPFFTVSFDEDHNCIPIERSAACRWFRELIGRPGDVSIGLHSLKKALLSYLASSECSHFTWQLAAYHKCSEAHLFSTYGHDTISRPMRAIEAILKTYLEDPAGFGEQTITLGNPSEKSGGVESELFSQSEASSDDEDDDDVDDKKRKKKSKSNAAKAPADFQTAKVDSAPLVQKPSKSLPPFCLRSQVEMERNDPEGPYGGSVTEEGEEEEENEEDEEVDVDELATDVAQPLHTATVKSSSSSSSSTLSVPPLSSPSEPSSSSSSSASLPPLPLLSESLSSSSDLTTSSMVLSQATPKETSARMPGIPEYSTQEERRKRRRKEADAEEDEGVGFEGKEEDALHNNTFSLMHTKSRVLRHRRPGSLHVLACGAPVTSSYLGGYEAFGYVAICMRCQKRV